MKPAAIRITKLCLCALVTVTLLSLGVLTAKAADGIDPGVRCTLEVYYQDANTLINGAEMMAYHLASTDIDALPKLKYYLKDAFSGRKVRVNNILSVRESLAKQIAGNGTQRVVVMNRYRPEFEGTRGMDYPGSADEGVGGWPHTADYPDMNVYIWIVVVGGVLLAVAGFFMHRRE